MSDIEDPKLLMMRAIPKLRAFAMSLCGRSARADDLVQETLLKAWTNISTFERGSNMIAWLFTILRNEYYSEFRRQAREVADVDGVLAAQMAVQPTQESHMQFQDFSAAFACLADDHREALILVGASGLSYEEAAAICGCALGTMKSRVNRARLRLAALLTGGSGGESASLLVGSSYQAADV
ncbi:MAG TPA: sigma-70 family RNA polymerase sigma factor [Acetobacteraceae bacterium]|nr:sigma-70 family RNA polymerase sigma factor [Acetobacteraceae bacterium]